MNEARERKGVRHWRLGAAVAGLAAALAAAGCGEESRPAGSVGSGDGNAGAASGTAGAGGAAGAESGGSAGAPVDVTEQIEQRQAEAGAAAGDHAGEDGSIVEVSGLAWTVPPGWERVAPGPMRAAELRAGEGPERAQVVFFYFGPGQGGNTQMNIDRWAQMVVDEDGRPVEPEVTNQRVAGIPVTLVAMEGTYMDGMPSGPKTAREGYAFRGAIAEGPRGSVFIRMTGPSGVVGSVQGAWEEMIAGMQQR